MNALTQDLARIAAQHAGVDLHNMDAKFTQALIELVAGHCADRADELDAYQTYNIGGEILTAFGMLDE